MLENTFGRIKKDFLGEEELSLKEQEMKEFFFKNILENKKFGDYIWAVKDDMNFDEEDERICPYIVIGKDGNKLIACRVTQNPFAYNTVTINKDNPRIKSYILVKDAKTIDYISYRYKEMYLDQSLNEEEMKKLRDALSSLGETVFYKDLGIVKSLKINKNQDFSAGDVIMSNIGKPALIIDTLEDGNYVCINLDTFDEKEGMINFNKEVFNFYKRFVLYKRNYKFLGTLPQKQTIAILTKYSEYLKKVNEYQKVKETKKLVRGAIINRFNNYYYVSTVEAKKAKLFLLELSNETDKDAIQFGDIYFRPNYQETSEIDENDIYYYLIRLSSEDEMELVQKDRKSKSKIKKQLEKEKPDKKQPVNKIPAKVEPVKEETIKVETTDIISNESFEDGDIIKSTKYANLRFLILGFYDETIITVSLEDLLKGVISVLEFNEDDSDLELSSATLEEEAFIDYHDNYLYNIFDNICNIKDSLEDNFVPTLKKDVQ